MIYQIILFHKMVLEIDLIGRLLKVFEVILIIILRIIFQNFELVLTFLQF
jgi:hypothetical protein